MGSAAFTTRKSEPVRLPRHQLQRNHWLLVTRVGGRVSAREAGGGRGGQLVPLLEAEDEAAAVAAGLAVQASHSIKTIATPPKVNDTIKQKKTNENQ